MLPTLDVGPNTLVWVHDQEPTSMHYDDPRHRLAVTSWIRRSLLEGLFGVSGSTEFYPELLVSEGEVVENGNGSVTINLTLRNGLRWSNGDRLTTAHVEYTWGIWQEGCVLDDDGTLAASGDECVYQAGDREGYELISGLTVSSPTEFSITMERFYAGWRELFDEIFHPSFGADAAAVNEAFESWTEADQLVSAGPLLLDSWERGVAMHLVRNDRYHGSESPDARNRGEASVDGVVVVFVQNTETQIRAIETGEAHVIMTQPQLAFAERLGSSTDFTVASSAGAEFEHWGLNVLNPHLADPLVRQALAMALDKSEVVEELYRPLFGNVLPRSGLGNVYWLTNQRFYEDHQAIYSGSQVDEAEAVLAEAGYSKADDGVHDHPERGRLSLRVGTTGGNPLRERQQEIIQAQMAKAGIEIVIDNVAGSAYLSTKPFSADALLASVTGGADGDPTVWDIAQFAWAGGPWPGGNSDNYRSGLASNPYGYANVDFDELAADCDATVDEIERAACYNQLDLYLTSLELSDDGLVVLPLTQKPTFYGYLSSVLSGAGIASGADAAGPLANVVDFSFK